MNNSEIITLIMAAIIAGVLAAGFLAGYSVIFVFNRMPAAWLSDYGEEPDASLYGERLSVRPYGMILSVVFVLLFTFLIMQYDSAAYSVIGMLGLWLLMLIGIADHKCMIIPDQLVIALAAVGAVLAVLELLVFGSGGMAEIAVRPPYFHPVWYSPFAGALIGGGSIWLIGMIGSILTKQEAMGFGDVKLLAAAGFMCGIRGILVILALTVLLSGVWFMLLILAKKIRRGDHKPLGPYIAASCGLYTVFYTKVNMLVDMYLGLYVI